MGRARLLEGKVLKALLSVVVVDRAVALPFGFVDGVMGERILVYGHGVLGLLLYGCLGLFDNLLKRVFHNHV